MAFYSPSLSHSPPFTPQPGWYVTVRVVNVPADYAGKMGVSSCHGSLDVLGLEASNGGSCCRQNQLSMCGIRSAAPREQDVCPALCH